MGSWRASNIRFAVPIGAMYGLAHCGSTKTIREELVKIPTQEATTEFATCLSNVPMDTKTSEGGSKWKL